MQKFQTVETLPEEKYFGKLYPAILIASVPMLYTFCIKVFVLPLGIIAFFQPKVFSLIIYAPEFLIRVVRIRI